MIDFHSHILPKIDDGLQRMEETIQVVKEAREAGFTAIIATPHYIEDGYKVEEKERKKLLKEVISKVNEHVDDINIYLGNEIYISNNMVQLIKDKKASTINGSRYILFELPMNGSILYLNEVIYTLLENQYIPIIAHPERYTYVQKNINILLELINMGVLFQSNYGSFIGIYGKSVKKTAKLLLQHKMVHFLGSDVHRVGTIYKNMPNAIKEIRKIITEDKFKELSEENPKLVLNNENIDIETPRKMKLGIWSI